MKGKTKVALAQDTGGAGSPGGSGGPYLVMVVDDSAVVRGKIAYA